ncbi:hypothetical protein [Phaeodactylibacter sp.]|uniref:DUF6909 family protein n=1 Tax=Phaeodactylibacter sp. TaxID=1940289 RepID=UPI0025E55A4C|nr:hypothetical protein [Phaeodactylibacter sp.]MCI4646955.1 hypothetical protein [Phaeodactylibacter sp.]MCI5090848.1 hypothetical protein [Phaeodactylibacter sp.]
MSLKPSQRSRAQESRAAIQRLYIAMRHLFIRGNYKPLGVSGEAIIEALTQLRPEIYGSINDPERVELDGLLYVFQRLPRGIEECRYIKLISREGFEDSNFEPIVPSKRRRNSYRIDEAQMYIEMTRGRSDIYDILTHLTFMYIEAEKIRRNSEDHKQRKRREWEMLEKIVAKEEKGEEYNKEIAYTYLSTLLGRTYEETVQACQRFSRASDVNSVFHITYWLGKLASEEAKAESDREISFSSALREKIGHHYYGDLWARNIKSALLEHNLLNRPLHIISANLHSVMNTLYAKAALRTKNEIEDLARELSEPVNKEMRQRVHKYAVRNGMIQIDDTSGTNISVQIIDTAQLNLSSLPAELKKDEAHITNEKPVILVMDYAFGEQAYETMDELLKPFEQDNGEEIPVNVQSIAIMGKAGILEGGKGDIMIPDAHVFEGTADNYPIENELSLEDFQDRGLRVFSGPMITVMGTSLQNRDILRYFLKSSWKAAGLEMEGAHYQKAIQAASKIRKSINEEVSLRYAYYASDNPLISGQTLASGSLGADGVKPTYLITIQFLNRILSPAVVKPELTNQSAR